MELHVQFEDASQQVIVSWFGAPQDPTWYEPGTLGTVLPNDLRWKVFYEEFPEWMRGGMPLPEESSEP